MVDARTTTLLQQHLTIQNLPSSVLSDSTAPTAALSSGVHSGELSDQSPFHSNLRTQRRDKEGRLRGPKHGKWRVAAALPAPRIAHFQQFHTIGELLGLQHRV